MNAARRWQVSRVTVWLLAGSGCVGSPAPAPPCRLEVWRDADADGSGDPNQPVTVCALAPGMASNADDCNDSRSGVNPFAAETCDGTDEDCDGEIDEALPLVIWYADLDGDGYGAPDVPTRACAAPPQSTRDGSDCDDTRTDISPGAPEVCDGVDNNCDDRTDDADPAVDLSTGTLYYRDLDDDGYGDVTTAEWQCPGAFPPWVETAGDCDDAVPQLNPGALEVCDGRDNNCDALVDDDDPLLDLATAEVFYEDLDGDGAGNEAVPLIFACVLGAGQSPTGGDCNDNDAALQELVAWVADADGDGVGTGAQVGGLSCGPPLPDTAPLAAGDDCNDADPAIYPDATETCGDGTDSDCNAQDCPDWTQGFEDPAGVWPPELGGGGFIGGWIVEPVAFTGAFGASSGDTANLDENLTDVLVYFYEPGTVTFWHQGESETGYDFFQFSLGGSLRVEHSGVWGWTQEVVPAGPGAIWLEWAYVKDDTVDFGADRVWIDDIVVSGGTLF